MSNYTKTTNFTSKDSLPSGNSDKIVKGSEIDTEFNNIQTAVATKLNTNDGALTGTTTFQTLSDGTISITAFVDEDNMASDSATLLPTQQSVKAYVDSQVTAQDLDFQADTGGALSIDLDSETLTFTGGTGVDTSGSGNAVTFAIDSTVATLTGTQTLSNKTLSTPVISGNLTTNGLIDGRDVATDGTKLDGIESGATGNQTAAEIKTAYESNADTNAFTDADHSKLDGIEASADVTDTANVTAAGALMDSELTAIASVKALNQGVATTDSPTFAGLTLGATALTATAAELNVLDGITSTTAELNILDGVTATTAELNILDGVTSTAAELNILDGVTSTAAELNILDGVTSTAAELNILDGVTATAAELNILDGVTATATELNYVDGVTSAIQTQLDAKAALAGANFTGNVDVAGTLTTDAFSIEDATSPTLTLNDTTSANQKTTLSHTAGASVLTTGDNGVFGSFKVAAFDGTSTINRLLIADNGDVSLYEDGGATAKLVWDSSAEALEFADNAKAIFGAGSDLQIYHDGAFSHIKDSGTGNLYIAGDNEIILTDAAENEYKARFNTNGSVQLYYDNAEKLATTSSGIDVTGTVTADGLTVSPSGTQQVLATLRANSGAGGGLVVQTDASDDGLIRGYDSSGNVQLQFDTDGGDNYIAQGNVGIGTSSIDFQASNRTVVHIEGSAGALLALEDTGAKSYLFQTGNDLLIENDTASGSMIFGTNSSTERMRIDSSGNLLVGTTNSSIETSSSTEGVNILPNKISVSRNAGATANFNRISTNGDIVKFRKDGSPVGSIGSIASNYLSIGTGDTGILFQDDNDFIEPCNVGTSAGRDNAISLGHSGGRFKDLYLSGRVIINGVTTSAHAWSSESNSSSSSAHLYFRNPNGFVGNISTSGTGTAYNTSSDYRLKENVVAMTGATARLKQLNPSRFNFIADADVTVDGFLAHEVQDIVPEAITGTKDAVDDDGNAVYQGIDQSKLVPLLVATIQELEARITQLENN